MPVLESGAVLYAESRVEELARLHALLHRDRRRVLAVRLGATDLCALYGLRRSPDLSIYDVKVISGLIADVVNVLGRADGTGFTVTGPVWEYFGGAERIFRTQLRASPFAEHNEPRAARPAGVTGHRRADPRGSAGPGQRPGGQDRHPPQPRGRGQRAVGGAPRGVPGRQRRAAAPAGPAGCSPPGYRNKMNEIRPHTAWARRTLLRARVFGVAAEDASFVDLLAASLSR